MNESAISGSTAAATLPTGFTFLFTDEHDGGHLHVVVSNTTHQHVVVTNLTTIDRFSDTSCVVNVGEHPWVRWASCIAYVFSEVMVTADLIHALNHGDITPREPFANSLLERVLDGAMVTRHLPPPCWQLLASQNLVA